MNASDLFLCVRAQRGRWSMLSSAVAMIMMMTAPPAAQGGDEEDSFNLDWNSIDCGGGEADGVDEVLDDWNLAGTIGQMDAGLMDGGEGGGLMAGMGDDGDVFTLEGGFWPGASTDPGAPPCPWDLHGDGTVEINDFLDLLAQWATNPGGPPDFDGSNDVGISDFLALLANWGPCP